MRSVERVGKAAVQDAIFVRNTMLKESVATSLAIKANPIVIVCLEQILDLSVKKRKWD